ncbi:MAG: AzlC family ABC transporter permease [Gammaproteobacteria bacterium]|nr:AzlC family ABC transporter permease [Gammaproteobacteria bacterium]
MSDIRNGLKAGAGVVPTFGVMFFGFGLAASVAKVPELAALAITLLVFAAPAQFAMADVAAQGGGVIQLVFIAVVVNLRFFVMSLTLAGAFDPGQRRRHLAWCQFVSATTYLTTFFHWRGGRVTDPFGFYQGVVLVALPAALLGTAVGVWFGAGMPALMAFAATLFLPVYFTLLIAGESGTRPELTAVVLGFLLTPPVEVLLPGWGLFIVSLAVGLGLYRMTAPEYPEDGGDD